MRRSIGVVIVLAAVVGCQERAPLGPGGTPRFSSHEGEDPFTSNARFYVLGRTWTSNGVTLRYLVEATDGVALNGDGSYVVEPGSPGLYSATSAGGVTTWSPYPSLENQVTFDGGFNDDVWPVVEVCQLVGDACGDYRGTFVRKAGEIEVGGGSEKYKLALNNGQNAWWSARPAGTYRVLIGAAPMGYALSDQVLGWFDASGSGSLMVQFRIENGALCADPENPEGCFEGSLDPNTSNTIILDEDLNEDEVEGVVGLQFPPGWFQGEITQVKVNLIIQRIFRQTNGELFCLPSELVEGQVQYDPCYSVRTEPYLGANAFVGNPVKFGVCLQQEAALVADAGLLSMWKFSNQKPADVAFEQIATDFFDANDAFFDCPPDYENTEIGALVEPRTGMGRFASAVGRVLRPVGAFLAPAPVYARRFVKSPFGGTLGDFSEIGMVGPEESYTASFMGPIGTELVSPMTAALSAPVTLRRCAITDTDLENTAACVALPAPAWSATSQAYQLNWKTDGLTVGLYRIDVLVDGTAAAGSPRVFARTEPGTIAGDPYRFQIGRTLPLKFYLTQP
jgi:hypothetical protein